ncbi:hypothetical protein RJ639_046125 [Escallonia herrerae]|uniref:Rubredoxin-like domain-containing protein n=1 Tax=Escallonia herrerae TaxID=1293975 RepID=A0AA88W5Q9_9ASTE|nr:hypothetical protein RJ639_046125 [Escallonia herrerae]
MASATARPTFTFNLSASLTQPSPPKPTSHLAFPLISSVHKHPKLVVFTPKSIDVSKQDKPTSEQPITDTPISETFDSSTPEVENIDQRRLQEKFAVLNTGIYECRSCGYLYNESAGDPSYPIPPGLPFDQMPEDWRCSTCGAAKSFFVSKSVEIAGFAENQQYGLGGNTLTSGQKAVLIYGSLLFFFVLFLSGYFLQ